MTDSTSLAKTVMRGSGCAYRLAQGFLGSKFDGEIKARADGIVNATIEVYERISKELLPTPARLVPPALFSG